MKEHSCSGESSHKKTKVICWKKLRIITSIIGQKVLNVFNYSLFHYFNYFVFWLLFHFWFSRFLLTSIHIADTYWLAIILGWACFKKTLNFIFNIAHLFYELKNIIYKRMVLRFFSSVSFIILMSQTIHTYTYCEKNYSKILEKNIYIFLKKCPKILFLK